MSKLPKEVHFDLKVATANVCGLKAGKHRSTGLLGQGKILSLQAQFTAAGFAIVAIQEAHMPAGAARTSRTWHALSSGDCELWFNMQSPYGFVGSRSLFWTPHDFTVVGCDARFLIVEVKCKHLHIYCASVHAPHSHRPESERDAWWQRFATFCHRLSHDIPCVFLGDFNATIDGRESAHAGLCGREPANSNTDAFYDFLCAFDLLVPSTTAVHEGSHATWRNGSRFDYVLVPRAFAPFCCSTRVCSNIDLGTVQEDHSCVMLHLSMRQVNTAGIFVSSFSSLGSAQLAEVQRRHRFVSLLDRVPECSWHLATSAHAEQFVADVHSLARECFPWQKKVCRQPYLSPWTWEGVQLRHRQSNRIACIVRMQIRLRKHKAFRVWFSAFTQRRQVICAGLLPSLRFLEQAVSDLRMCHVQAVATKRALHPLVRQGSWQDRQAEKQHIADQFHHAAE